VDGFLANLRKVNPAAEILFASARTGDGVDSWCDWLRARL
jgi:hydrogenase nickel incorporation protein HypB